jgi:hypothetical protein
MDLLSFLDEPPPTPHADVNRTQSAENAIARVYEPPPQQQPPNVVQRAVTDEPEEKPEKDSVGNADVNVDQLARDVYSVLRNRLRIERERRDRKP